MFVLTQQPDYPQLSRTIYSFAAAVQDSFNCFRTVLAREQVRPLPSGSTFRAVMTLSSTMAEYLQKQQPDLVDGLINRHSTSQVPT